MEISSLLLGAGIALGSAFLGVIGEAAKGWLARRSALEDRQSAFTHRTAIELQDLLLKLVSSTGEILGFAKRLSNVSGVWSFEDVPLEMGRAHRNLIAKIGALHERLDHAATREQVKEVLNIAAAAIRAESEVKSNEAYERLMALAFPANAALGKVIRSSFPRD